MRIGQKGANVADVDLYGLSLRALSGCSLCNIYGWWMYRFKVFNL